MFEPWLHDPGKTLLLTHQNGLQLSPETSRIYKNQREHDPLDIHKAREIASAEDPIPVGILYQNPDVPCYEDLRGAGQPRTAERTRAGLEAELTRSRSGRTKAHAPAQPEAPATRTSDPMDMAREIPGRTRLSHDRATVRGDGLALVDIGALWPASWPAAAAI